MAKTKRKVVVVNKKRKKNKKYKVEPTARMKEAFQKIVAEKGRNKGKILKEVGYSDEVATHPHKVTRTRGWEQLMKKYIPDSLLARKHNELLNAKKKITRIRKGGEVEKTEEIDTPAIRAGIEMGYKLKGRYQKDNEQKKPDVFINIERRQEINKALDDL